MRKILTASVAGLWAVVAAACGGSSDADPGAGQLPSVVVTTNVLGDIVTKALGDLVGTEIDVEVIMPVGADPHDFAPSAKQAESMENADLLVVNGNGFEAGMTDVISNAVDSFGTSGFAAFSFGGVLEPQEGVDPHVWMDPVLVADALSNFAEPLALTTGVPIADLSGPVDAYVEQLRDLDTSIASILAAVPDERRKLITNHDSVRRFADRYGFEVVGTIIPSFSTSAEASAADLEALAELIVADDIPAIFAETTETDRLAQALADEVGSTVEVVELFTESLGQPGTDADSYIGFMTADAELIAAALG